MNPSRDLCNRARPTYKVEVLDKGFRLDGKTYPSLSAIARYITGTTWSGPRFFGLTDRAGGKG